MPLPVMQTLFCDAGAQILLARGIDGLTVSAVAAHTGIGASRVTRVYGSRFELAAAIYRRGHSRIAAVCARDPRPGEPPAAALIDLVFDLVDGADTDPAVQVMPLLETADFAASTGLASIYRLWHHRFLELLSADAARAHIRRGDTEHDYRHVQEIADVLVDALAGFSALHRAPIKLLDRLHHTSVLLTGIIAAMRPNADDAEHLRRYAQHVQHTHIASRAASEQPTPR